MKNYAPRWKRVIHYIVDVGLIFILIRILFTEAVMNNELSPVYAMLIGAVIYLVYVTIFELVFSKTLGKVLTKTSIRDLNGDTPKLSNILIRTISRIIPFNSLVTLISSKGFHDRISKTICLNDN